MGKEQEDLYDGAGNKIDRNAQDTSTDKEKKKQLKALEKKIKDNKKNKMLTAEEEFGLQCATERRSCEEFPTPTRRGHVEKRDASRTHMTRLSRSQASPHELFRHGVI